MTVIRTHEPTSQLYRGAVSMNINLALQTGTQKYPAKHNCRLVASLLPRHSSALIYLPSAVSSNYENSDQARPFRQRRDFQYLTGCSLPDCSVAYDVQTDLLILFIPPLDPKTVLWSGLPMSPDEAKKKYDVDRVLTTFDELEFLDSWRREEWRCNATIYSWPDVLPFDNVDTTCLPAAVSACRVIKTPQEIALIRKANEVTTAAHIKILKNLPWAKNEADLEGVYIAECIKNFAKNQAYEPIVGCGTNAAVLHYTKNNSPINKNNLLLVDAGAEWEGYAADVTRTFPITGYWTKEQKQIHDLVEKMQDECIKRCVSGTDFRGLYDLAHHIATEGLIQLGILKGDLETLFRLGTSKAFFPHGLGHMVGLDVHDVDSASLKARNLTGASAISKQLPAKRCESGIEAPRRINRVAPRGLEPGMVVTIEPGIYFQRFIIEPYLKSPIHGNVIDREVLEKYWAVGGVRIEDDILVTRNGNENLTNTPKGEEMLKIIREAWKIKEKEDEEIAEREAERHF
ncbi:putative Xaa-Pro aminopeptidase pepP [Pyronema omphalodes]|nr:putative Xaa-Pro aminopeptidase pepP [Pyronema omphalodes]